MRKVSEIVVLAGENCGSQLSVSSQTYFLKTIHQLSMPNGNFKKIWPQVFVMMVIFTKMLQQNIFIS